MRQRERIGRKAMEEPPSSQRVPRGLPGGSQLAPRELLGL